MHSGLALRLLHCASLPGLACAGKVEDAIMISTCKALVGICLLLMVSSGLARLPMQSRYICAVDLCCRTGGFGGHGDSLGVQLWHRSVVSASCDSIWSTSRLLILCIHLLWHRLVLQNPACGDKGHVSGAD